ncbi:lysostaphin resistance A-like protein [Nonomuraea sp. NPDC050556]|uniref:lysostaphin resistance A-like protein n=1 Tax=Nonomuraea sp. NPDC050556 TaxID=3364369 RepID=UPI003787E716
MLRVFLAVAFGLSWLVALPLWLGDGLATPSFGFLAVVMMFTPTLGVLAVWALSRTPFKQWAAETGLTLGGSKVRTALLVVGAWVGVPVLIVAAQLISAGLGLVSLDLAGFSVLREVLGARAPENLAPVAVAQVAGAVIAGPLLNAIFTFGEEWGWRGWLLPRLVASRGVVGGLVLSGVIWGVWHAPLTLLGYNYPGLGPWAALYFVGFCVLAGVVMGWLRLRSGSIWPAVVAHASINAVTPALLVATGDAQSPPNLAIAGFTGLVGWGLLAVLGFALLRFSPVER